MIRSNLDSVFIGTKAAVKYMKLTGSGFIINISFFVSIIPTCYRCSYVASKHTIKGFTRSAADELAPFGIRVNAVAVDSINTEMQKAVNRSPEDLEKLAESFALHRMGEPEEAANVYLFWGSEMSTYITGIVVETSGCKLSLLNCNQAWIEQR